MPTIAIAANKPNRTTTVRILLAIGFGGVLRILQNPRFIGAERVVHFDVPEKAHFDLAPATLSRKILLKPKAESRKPKAESREPKAAESLEPRASVMLMSCATTSFRATTGNRGASRPFKLPSSPSSAAGPPRRPGTISLGQGVVSYGPPPEAIAAARQVRRHADRPSLRPGRRAAGARGGDRGQARAREPHHRPADEPRRRDRRRQPGAS